VVDQLAAWVLRDRIDKLPANGGFARLRREGKYFPEMAFAHAATETAPGHAARVRRWVVDPLTPRDVADLTRVATKLNRHLRAEP